MISSSFNWVALLWRFALFWMTNTIQNVRTVVVVLMNSCQVSEKSKSGPVTAQITTSPTEPTSAANDPAAAVTLSASRLKRSRRLVSDETAMQAVSAPRCCKRDELRVFRAASTYKSPSEVGGHAVALWYLS